MIRSCVAALGAAAFVLLASTAPLSAGPAVVVSIKPVHSLVAGVMRGIGELRVKESDRILAMANGLGALGVQVEELADGSRPTGSSSCG